jgi:predicted SnoaL-like aldol condensation-catalyzing enzyme
MSVEDNKAVVRRFVEEVQSQHRLELVDDLIDPDYIDHAVPAGQPPVRGPAYFKQFFTMMIQAFPDVHATIHDQIAPRRFHGHTTNWQRD